MADVLASEGAYPEALSWLELAGERVTLNSAEAAKRCEWIALVRRSADTQPRARRRVLRPKVSI